MNKMYHLVDNEMWSPILNLNLNEKPYYFISTYGRVYSFATNSFIIPHETEKGYLQVSIMLNGGRVHRKVHRLVMLTFSYFYGCENFQVNHKDGNKKNNNINNLEWATPKENIAHAIHNNLRNDVGENNPMAKISESDALKIYELLINKVPDDTIAGIVGCNKEIIRNIAFGKTWRYLFSQEQLNNMLSTRKGHILPIEKKHAICKYYEDYSSLYPNEYGKGSKIATDALVYNNLEVNKFNHYIAKRLFYRYQDDNITSQYNY